MGLSDEASFLTPPNPQNRCIRDPQLGAALRRQGRVHARALRTKTSPMARRILSRQRAHRMAQAPPRIHMFNVLVRALISVPCAVIADH